ncbi:hypothetical protein [Frigoribacterium sp. 2355]
MIKKWTARLLAVALVASALTVVSIAADDPRPASAASGADFDPGNIISDANFYAAGSMTLDNVQSFLNQQVPSCRASSGPACLKSYTMDTFTRQDSGARCGTYPGGPGQSAAAVIYNVAQICGISPKVLLVLLEKEQGIVTSSAPTAYMYRSATGYGCPDTAACDAQYYGFFNQVYGAALQFKRYAATPTSWSYQAGRTNNIFYHPNASCGTKPVYIQNQATASLYIYTPYTPNAAALANMYGTGDSCSAYGNRNFFRIYTDWFGSTTGGGSPYGYVDTAAAGFRQVTVSGWAVDPDSAAPIRVDFYVDGRGAASTVAGNDYPSLAGVLGKGNTAHGFSANITGMSAGRHSVCSYAINVGTGVNTLLDCREFVVRTGDPFGYVDSVSASAGSLTVKGWVVDPDTADPITARVTVDGRQVSSQIASGEVPGLPAVYPGWGTRHAFESTVTGVSGGSHRVCVQGVNVGAGSTVDVACQTVVMASGAPSLFLDEVSMGSPGKLLVRGWAIDPDTVDPVRVHVYVDGALSTKVTADVSKASLATAFPGYGDKHAFSVPVAGLSAGTHSVCVYAINVGAGGNAVRCADVAAPTGSPRLFLDQAQGTALGQITVRGWSFDPDVVDPVRVHLYLDGRLVTKVTADVAKASLGTSFPGYGEKHAFTATLTGVGPGAHTLCTYAINVGGGGNTVDCRTVSAVTGSPSMLLDEVSSPSAGAVLARGWTIDPDTVDPLRVHVYVDGLLQTKVTADVEKSSLGTAFPAFGPRHQFSASVAGLAAGQHSVCLYSINVGAGANTVVCSPVMVR